MEEKRERQEQEQEAEQEELEEAEEEREEDAGRARNRRMGWTRMMNEEQEAVQLPQQMGRGTGGMVRQLTVQLA